MAVFAKSDDWATLSGQLMDAWGRYRNGRKYGTNEVLRLTGETEDMSLIRIPDAIRRSSGPNVDKLRRRKSTYKALFGASAAISWRF